MSITDLGVLIGALGIFLGVPQWRIARRQLFDDQVKRAIIGDQPAPPSPDNPSLVDATREVLELVREQNELSAIVAWHLSDGHGPELPPWLQHVGRR